MYKTVNIPQQTYQILEDISDREKMSKVSIVQKLIEKYEEQIKEAEEKETREANQAILKIADKIKIKELENVKIEDIDEGIGDIDELIPKE